MAYAPWIAFVTRQRIMPPWPPGPDSPEYVGQAARQLTRLELATIAAWVAHGAPLGKAVSGTVPQPPRPAGSLTLQMPVAYVPSAADGATDDYHCFVLEPKLRQDEFVTSVQIQPGAPSIVHHVILFRETGVAAAAARNRNRATAGKGWSCFGGTGLPGEGANLMDAPWLGAWVPGKTSTATPAGTGVLLPRGSVIVMQVHYNLLHGVKPDRSRAVLGLRPASSHLTPLETMLLPAPVELPCPRGETGSRCNRDVELRAEGTLGSTARTRRRPSPGSCSSAAVSVPGIAAPPPDPTRITTSCDRRLQSPVTVYGVAGHMHTRGRDIRLVLDPAPRGSARCSTFRSRGASTGRTPTSSPGLCTSAPATCSGSICRFNNTVGAQPSVNGVHLPPRYVVWGEGTTDEMCLGLVEYTAG